MRINKKNLKDKNSSMYQLVIPVIVKDELEIKYKDIIEKKGFQKKSLDNDVSDLLYLNIIEETYKSGFDVYIKECEETQFIINSCINKEIKKCLKFNILECSFIFDKNSLQYSKKEKIFITLLLENIEEENNSIPKEKILTILSEYHNHEINTYGSMIVSKDNTTYFLHGDFSTSYGLANRFSNFLDFFEEKSFIKYKKEFENESDNEKKKILKNKMKQLSTKINYPFGKNIFITYYEKDEQHLNKVQKAIRKEFESETQKDELYTLVSNLYETKSYYNLEVDDYDEIIKNCFYTKWIKNNSIYVTTPNTFGVILKDNDQNNPHPLDPSIIFTKYSLAIFFALNQRILILDLQESIKGVKYNNYDELNNYYRYIEQYVFYEISPEIQLQKLYNMIQSHMNNTNLMSIINSEIEISQNRRLNDIFKKFTMYGLYLAVLAIIISVPSYLATFYSISGDYGKVYTSFSKFLSNPFIITLLCIIIYIITIIYLNKKVKK